MEEAKKNKKIRVAICQFESHQPSPSSHKKRGWAEHELKNLEKAKQFIAHAADNRADLIIFPEYFMTGLIDNDLHLADKEFKWIKEFQNLAIRYKIDILPGTIVEQEEEEGKLFNSSKKKTHVRYYRSASYVDKCGKILGKYRKKNLWFVSLCSSFQRTFTKHMFPSIHTDHSINNPFYLAPCPNTNQVFEVLNGIRIGMLICWDLAWPEAFRELMKQDVDVIIIPSYWTLDVPSSKMNEHDPEGTQESNLINSLVSSRSLETESCVIFVNCAGRKENGFLGRSTVNLPLKGNLLGFIEPDEQIQIIDIDLSVLQDVREVYKIRHEFDSKSFA
ncbi:hypothetical protein PSTG_06210 [Puccinia striiformis f. sp. tritici PST-78]|uniref:CN hydrolase domain-containing protein n=1 Tax=Puccinia striiformis f. sp. tritici PST-78 TaxID=1165861 RepID=A0A0L0VML4_9BASI|nr:hypothetical protein PSTG_06210 [Puccinia striiformis f. sp. tritici PST-78]